MKYIIKSTLLLLCGAAFLTACDDDRDNNPVLQEPTSFTLNTPAYSKANVDLQTSDNLTFTWSQPAYGFPARASYQIQMSPTNTWTKDVQDGEVDAADMPVGDYKTFDTEFFTVNGSILASDMATALEQITHYAKDAVPESQNIYVRVRAAYGGDTIYSNAVALKVLPYYVELKDAAIDEWYLIGGCIGDGAWTNDPSAIGTSVIPLYTEAGQEYSKDTGVGTLTYTGYFPAAGEFKIIHSIGDNWQNTKDVICAGLVFRDGGDDPGNVVVDKAGYYKITLDPVKRTCTMEELSDTPATYATMTLAGGFNGWSFTPMNACSTVEGSVNHDWYYDLDTSASDTEVKFTVDDTWAHNWGDTGFPYGYATAGGSNIPVKAGKYRVFFNDITGQYHFIELSE